jgi:hypothetical protein
LSDVAVIESNEDRIERAAHELLRRKAAQDSLHEFIRQAWHVMEPGVEFRDNWHIDAICLHLEAVYRGEVKNLLINQPPRSMKTLITSVAFPVWCWLQNPTLKFIYASYSYTLTEDASIKCRSLIRSRWFKARWGDRIKISEDRDTKEFFANTEGGERITTSVDGTVTGRGGDILVCLPYDVLVLTESGWAKIGDIVKHRLDVSVASFNHAKGAVELMPIESWQQNPARPLLELETEDGKILRLTEDHPVWVEGRGYIAAGLLKPGDVVLEVDDGLLVPSDRA